MDPIANLLFFAIQLKERNGSRYVRRVVHHDSPRLSPVTSLLTRPSTVAKLSRSTSRPTTISAASPRPPSRATSTVPLPMARRAAISCVPRVSSPSPPRCGSPSPRKHRSDASRRQCHVLVRTHSTRSRANTRHRCLWNREAREEGDQGGP